MSYSDRVDGAVYNPAPSTDNIDPANTGENRRNKDVSSYFVFQLSKRGVSALKKQRSFWMTAGRVTQSKDFWKSPILVPILTLHFQIWIKPQRLCCACTSVYALQRRSLRNLCGCVSVCCQAYIWLPKEAILRGLGAEEKLSWCLCGKALMRDQSHRCSTITRGNETVVVLEAGTHRACSRTAHFADKMTPICKNQDSCEIMRFLSMTQWTCSAPAVRKMGCSQVSFSCLQPLLPGYFS